jgi:hypothetical protein
MSKSRTGGNGSRAWAERSAELARWALAWVNRVDVWGGHRPLHERGRRYTRPDGSTGVLNTRTTRPVPSKRRQVFLTEAVLAWHFKATCPNDVVGLHSTGPENLSRWGAVDVDWHGPTSTSPEINLRAALGWYGKLRGLGFTPLLTDSNGQGGFHLRVLFAEPVATPMMYAFMRWLVADHAPHGLPTPPETFPKQAALKDTNRYGNWLRLPGRHHTREHWSRVWDGNRWLTGADAVAYLLTLTGDSPALIPADITVPEPQPEPLPRVGPRCRVPGPPGGFAKGRLARRISAYIAKLPNLGEGQGRDDVAYQFTCWLVRDLGLADDVALQWLRIWDAGNRPPKGDGRLREILASAHRYGQREYGAGLSALPVRRPFTVPRWRPRHQLPITFHIEV